MPRHPGCKGQQPDNKVVLGGDAEECGNELNPWLQWNDCCFRFGLRGFLFCLGRRKEEMVE